MTDADMDALEKALDLLLESIPRPETYDGHPVKQNTDARDMARAAVALARSDAVPENRCGWAELAIEMAEKCGVPKDKCDALRAFFLK